MRALSSAIITARLSVRAPHTQIKRALTAVTWVRLFETDNKAAELRQRKPHWHAPAQHPALLWRFVRSLAGAFARHYQRKSHIVCLRAAQEGKQRRMGFALCHAMQ